MKEKKSTVPLPKTVTKNELMVAQLAAERAERLRFQLMAVDRDYKTAVAARDQINQELAVTYRLEPEDRVDEDGTIIRASKK